MIIKIFSNEIPGGWSPLDLEKSLGGSEETIVLLAKALAEKHEVIVYHSQKDKSSFIHDGVVYKDHSEANCYDDEVFITVKDNTPWLNGARGKVNLHWTAEVERPWDTSMLDAYVHISEFHKSRNLWVPSNISKAIPHGIDIPSLDKNKAVREENTLLYCSSPDRGLEVLLKDWPKIKERHPEFILKISYGFEMLKACSNNNPKALEYIDYMLGLMQQSDIHYLGSMSKDDLEKEYWKAHFWILPLQKAESELFCLNAVKSSYCGAIPIVNKIGALKDTVGEYIPYKNLINGKLETTDKKSARYQAFNWSNIVCRYWENLIQG